MMQQKVRAKRQFSKSGRYNQLISLEFRKKISMEVKDVMLKNPGISAEGIKQLIGHDASVINVYYTKYRRELYPSKKW